MAINKLTLKLNRPVPTISNWIATVDVSGCGIKGDGTVTYIMKRVEADNAWEVGRNTTGTFDLSSYGYGAGTYAFAVAVTGGTNYNDAQSTFGSYVVDDSGSGGSIWERCPCLLQGIPNRLPRRQLSTNRGRWLPPRFSFLPE
ncbi:MAG: hypothetical protein ACLR23_08035 [Clostridia bacterium]